MKDYSSSLDREQLRRVKYGTTPEQRLNWLTDAQEFARSAANARRAAATRLKAAPHRSRSEKKQ